MPDMARETIPDGGFRIVRSTVRAERGDVVYEATMTLTGRWTARPAHGATGGRRVMPGPAMDMGPTRDQGMGVIRLTYHAHGITS